MKVITKANAVQRARNLIQHLGYEQCSKPKRNMHEGIFQRRINLFDLYHCVVTIKLQSFIRATEHQPFPFSKLRANICVSHGEAFRERVPFPFDLFYADVDIVEDAFEDNLTNSLTSFGDYLSEFNRRIDLLFPLLIQLEQARRHIRNLEEACRELKNIRRHS